jgi:hypothetical protein
MNTIPILLWLQKLIIGVLVLILLETSCARIIRESAPTPLPVIPAWQLLLDAKPFPKDWDADPCNPERCLRETYAARVFGIVGVPGHVIQNVFRLDNIEAAKAKFRTYREVDFRPRQPPNHQFLPPPEITYHSLLADEYYLGCGVDEVPACRAIFRYSNYFVYFYFDIDGGKGDGLKIREVEPILRAMDERAAAVLGLRLRAEPTKTP